MTLQDLIAERDIRHGLGLFARILDTKQWDALGEVFAEDMSFDYGAGGEQHGLDALRTQMRSFLDHCAGTQHLIGSIIVAVAGDSAVSRAYVQARHQGLGETATEFFDSNGEYTDRWEKRGGRWLIVRRDARWQVHMGNPAVLAAQPEDLAKTAAG